MISLSQGDFGAKPSLLPAEIKFTPHPSFLSEAVFNSGEVIPHSSTSSAYAVKPP